MTTAPTVIPRHECDLQHPLCAVATQASKLAAACDRGGTNLTRHEIAKQPLPIVMKDPLQKGEKPGQVVPNVFQRGDGFANPFPASGFLFDVRLG